MAVGEQHIVFTLTSLRHRAYCPLPIAMLVRLRMKILAAGHILVSEGDWEIFVLWHLRIVYHDSETREIEILIQCGLSLHSES